MYCHRTPLQLINLRSNMIDPLQVPDDYGIDPEQDANNDVKAVDVNPHLCPLNEEKWNIYIEVVLPINIDFPKSEMLDYYFYALNTLHDVDENC